MCHRIGCLRWQVRETEMAERALRQTHKGFNRTFLPMFWWLRATFAIMRATERNRR